MKKEVQKKILDVMIELYCTKKHNGKKVLCAQCKELTIYANKRLELCRWGKDKPFCSHCPTPCYKPEMKQRMKEVMRFSGPRMIVYHPIALIKHAFGTLGQRLKRRKNGKAKRNDGTE